MQYFYTIKGIAMDDNWSMLQLFVKERRRQTNLTQPQLAAKAGVGLRFVRELEQGKTTLRMDKVNLVLRLFGHELAPAPFDREKYLNEKG